MAETLILPETGSREEKYKALIPQIEALLSGEENRIANMANVCAALNEAFGWLWIGFYLVDNAEELVLGPFQGPIACTRIKKGKGVCGTAWEKKEVQIVPDVDKFPGHIACSSSSRSEIVLPYFDKDGNILGVLDIDSSELNTFDELDARYLAELIKLIK